MQYYSTQKSRVLSNAKRIKNERNYLKAKRQNESMKTLNLKLSAKNRLPAINFWYARIIRVPSHKKYEKTPNKYSYPHVSSPKLNENEKHLQNNFLMNLNTASPSHKTFISKIKKEFLFLSNMGKFENHRLSSLFWKNRGFMFITQGRFNVHIIEYSLNWAK